MRHVFVGMSKVIYFFQLLIDSIFTMLQNVKEEKKQQLSDSGGKWIQT